MLQRTHVCGAAWLGAASILWVAATAGAVPQSLRSLEDVRELGDVFMRSLVAGDVAAGYRSLGPFWTQRSASFGAAIVAAEKRRAELRARIGLSQGADLVAERAAGEHAVRLTYFERFDRGGVVWQLVFIKPDQVWLIAEVSESDALSELFEAPRAAGGSCPPGDAGSGAVSGGGAAGPEPES